LAHESVFPPLLSYSFIKFNNVPILTMILDCCCHGASEKYLRICLHDLTKHVEFRSAQTSRGLMGLSHKFVLRIIRRRNPIISWRNEGKS